MRFGLSESIIWLGEPPYMCLLRQVSPTNTEPANELKGRGDYDNVETEKVYDQLEEVIDPELEVNIVDLGLVRDVEVDTGDVEVLMTLTTPGCPLAGVFDQIVAKELRKLDEVESVEVELTFDPRWTPEEMSDDARDQLGHVPGL
jgi:Predicted metal-sulfur cluster biosynthetic enzyme